MLQHAYKRHAYMLQSESGKCVFVLPQCNVENQALGEVSSELLDTQVNPTVREVSGHIVLKRKDYEESSEKKSGDFLQRFQEVVAIIFEAISCAVIERMLSEDEQDVDKIGGRNNGPHVAIMPGKCKRKVNEV
ncbi:GDP-D-glucose phosphorylase 1 [Artemisia annua]|uniref:GDP-D-glucose phosphorylase 1 n=1 Tax=Artemisia annua TaxID=35608 RepID=A0A2U1NRG6_ARTAN|nr:GDP-D-glucose phosphorylase 1 [Artemisia annua]